MASDSKVTRVILCGNPGTGKSTILNSVLGTVEFPSGVSIGTGKTRAAKVVEKGGVEYVDTPGLDDVTLGQIAAEEISKSLSKPGRALKLIFVITLEGGSLKASDVRTIRSIVSALSHVGVHMKKRFSVIVNKCGERVLELVRDKEFFKQTKRELGMEWGLCDLSFFPFQEDAAAAPDAMLQPHDKLTYVVEHAPMFELPEGHDVLVLYENPSHQVLNIQDEISFQKTGREERGGPGFAGWFLFIFFLALVIIFTLKLAHVL